MSELNVYDLEAELSEVLPERETLTSVRVSHSFNGADNSFNTAGGVFIAGEVEG